MEVGQMIIIHPGGKNRPSVSHFLPSFFLFQFICPLLILGLIMHRSVVIPHFGIFMVPRVISFVFLLPLILFVFCLLRPRSSHTCASSILRTTIIPILSKVCYIVCTVPHHILTYLHTSSLLEYLR